VASRLIDVALGRSGVVVADVLASSFHDQTQAADWDFALRALITSITLTFVMWWRRAARRTDTRVSDRLAKNCASPSFWLSRPAHHRKRH